MRCPLSLNRKGGIVAIYVLILCLFYATVGLTLLAYHLGAFNDSMNLQDQAQARSLAQSALQEARYFVMRINPSWTGTSGEFTMGPVALPAGTYQYEVTRSCKKYQITGHGYVPNSSARRKISSSMTLTVRDPNPWVPLTDSFESGTINTNWTTSGACASTSGVLSTASWSALNNGNAKTGNFAARASRTGVDPATLYARMCTPVLDLDGCDQVVIRFVYKRSGVAPDSFQIYQDSGSGFGAAPIATLTPSSATYNRPSAKVTVTTGLTSTTQFRFDVGMSALTQALYLDDVQVSVPLSVYDSSVD